MIEPTGQTVDVLGLPNRQSKVGVYQGGKGQKQDPKRPVPNQTPNPNLVGDDAPGATQREMPRSTSGKQGQDAGSFQAGVQSSGTERVNKGAAETSGHTAIGGPVGVHQQGELGTGRPDPGSVGSIPTQESLKQGVNVGLMS